MMQEYYRDRHFLQIHITKAVVEIRKEVEEEAVVHGNQLQDQAENHPHRLATGTGADLLYTALASIAG